MELRVLEYFLAVAREQNISKAAEHLHLTQPTLSRQLKELEGEFGKQLFIRGKRRITLTEDGIYFRRRAEEIVSLAEKTKKEMKSSDDKIVGDIYIGAGETDAVHHIAKVAGELREEYGGIRFHIVSGDTCDLTDRLDKGLFDFCLLMGDVDRSKYEYMDLPFKNRWGVLVSSRKPLAEKGFVTPEDLWDKPLILSRQTLDDPKFMRWLKRPAGELDIAATYNLVINASIMAMEELGYVLTLEGLINTEGGALKFLPFEPEHTLNMTLVWKKYKLRSKAAEKFIEALEAYIKDM